MKPLLFLLCFILPLCSVAQKKFSPGTVLMNSGDTLRGYLMIKQGRINPRVIQYKKTLTSETKSFFPSEVKWFRFNGGDWYFSYIGTIESSSLDNNNLNYDSSMHTVMDTMFVNAVIISNASLFYARDRNDRVHLFISKNGSTITELAYKKYYVNEIVLADYRNQITKRAVMANQMYKGQLMQAFSDCRFVATGITSRILNYTKNDMLRLFEDYNRCRQAKVVYKGEKDNGKLDVSLEAGLNFPQVKLSSTLYDPWNVIDFDRGFGYQVGLGFNWLLPQLDNKWSFNNEVLIKGHHIEGSDNATSPTTYTMNATYLKVITMGQFQLPYGTVRPILGLGMSNSLLLGYKTTGQAINGTPSIFDDIRNYEQGLVFNAGARWKKVTGILRFEKSNGWSGYSDLKSSFTTWYFQFGYIF